MLCVIFARLLPNKRKMMVGGGLSLLFLLTAIIVTISTIIIKPTPKPGDLGMDIFPFYNRNSVAK